MKLSISLTDGDIEVLDHFAAEHGLASRSAVVQHAIRALGHERLVQDYIEEFAEWDGSEDAALWDSVSGDGLRDEAW